MIGTRPPNTIVAAASRRTLDQIRTAPSSPDATSLWSLYDRLGELGYGVGFKANAAARLNYYPAVKTDSEPEQTDLPQVEDAFNRIQGPAGDLGDMVAELVIHLDVPGEGFLVGQVSEEDPDGELWDVWSAAELKTAKGSSNRRNVDAVTMADPDPFILRIWRPHPQDRSKATSPLSHVADIAERLILIRGALDAAMRSRLIGKILTIPDELTIVSNSQLPDDGAEIDQDPFFKELVSTMITAVRDDRSAARIAPIVLRGPGDRLMQIQALDLVRDLPNQLIEMETAAVRSLAAGMDLPAEILLGLSDSNHWSAWLIDESAYRQHVDPIVQTILDSITRGYLWPTLQEGGMDPIEARQYLLWRDMSPVTVRSVTIDDAINLYDRGIISAEAVRADAGYSEDEAGEPPAIPVAAPAPVDVPGPPDQIVAAAAGVVLTGLAQIDRTLTDKLTEASQAALDRALERAGAKIRSHAAKDRAVSDKIAPATVTNLRVAAVLGPDVVHRLQLNDADLIPADSFDRLAERADRLFATAQNRTATELSKLTGPTVRNVENEKSWRRKAVDLLIAGMISVGLSRLFKPDAKADPSETGEIGDTVIPADLIRDTLTTAGGGVPSTLPNQPRGLALGEMTQNVLQSNGFTTVGYEWDYGDPSSRERNYEPHLALDGVQFGDWEDATLATTDEAAWTDVSGFFPGDHKGCQCQTIPIVKGA